MIEVRDATELDRFEVLEEGVVVGFLDYRRDSNGAVLLTHAEVRSDVEGRGVGSALVKGALDELRARDERIVPLCSFVRAYVRDNPEYRALVA